MRGSLARSMARHGGGRRGSRRKQHGAEQGEHAQTVLRRYLRVLLAHGRTAGGGGGGKSSSASKGNSIPLRKWLNRKMREEKACEISSKSDIRPSVSSSVAARRILIRAHRVLRMRI